MDTSSFFLSAITLLLIQVMDAVKCREWVVFPGLSRLPEVKGDLIFTLAHIPLIFIVFMGIGWGWIFHPAVRIPLDLFCLAHVGLHWLFHKDPNNGFGSRFSWSIILACGLAGLVDILILMI